MTAMKHFMEFTVFYNSEYFVYYNYNNSVISYFTVEMPKQLLMKE